MDASSISEEDIVGICVQKSHTHPLGVLQYSVAESVILFSTMEDLNWVSRNLMNVMVLHDEALMAQTMALLEAHVAMFTLVWHLKPTTGEGELHTPPQQTHPSEGTLHHLHAKLGDLNDNELWQLIKDLMQEIVQCELTAPPRNPLLMTGYIHRAAGSLRKMTRRSPFQEGEGGVQRGKPPQYQSHQLGKSSLWTTAAIGHVLHQQDQTWGD